MFAQALATPRLHKVHAHQGQRHHLVPTDQVRSIPCYCEESVGQVRPPRQHICERPGQSHLDPREDTTDLALTIGDKFTGFIEEARESRIDGLVGLGCMFWIDWWR